MSRQPFINSDFVKRVIQFCRFARSRGLSAAVKESVDVLQALRISGSYDRQTLKIVLRAVLCSSKDEWDLFEEVFENFWDVDNRAPPRVAPGPRLRRTPAAESHRRYHATSLHAQATSDQESDRGRAVLGATAVERLKKTDFSEIPQDDLADLDQLSWRLVRQMALRVSRRLKAMAPSGQVDLRRTIHRNISRGGDLVELRFKGKKREQNRLVILLDVSGSMNAYSIFLLKFAYVLQRHFRQANTFVFSTRLEDVSSALRARHLSEAMQALSGKPAGWSGGTRIGESLREFNVLYARKLLTRDTFFIILSDGWDTGEPDVLAGELAAIKLRTRRLIWLNPLLGMPEYQPVTRGMSAALPWIDVFAPAHNLVSLLSLERHLARK